MSCFRANTSGNPSPITGIIVQDPTPNSPSQDSLWRETSPRHEKVGQNALTHLYINFIMYFTIFMYVFMQYSTIYL